MTMNQEIKRRIESIRNGEVPEGYQKTAFGIFPCDWVKDKNFGELFSFYGGIGKSRDELSDKGYPYLHYGDLHRGAFNVVSFEQYTRLPKCAVELSGGENYLMEDGDVAFLDASEDLEGTSRSVLIDNPNNKPFIAGLHIIYGKPKDNSLSKWYKQYITTTENVKKQFQKLAVGFKVYGLNRETLPKIKLSFPKSTQEQTKIAEILMQWDKAIELQGKLVESYQKLKKYCLNKMFPKKGSNVPEIRFPGFTALWEQRKLGDIAEIQGGNAWKSSDYCIGGKYLVVTIANVMGEYFIDDAIGNRINIRDNNPYILNPNDILISLTGNVGRVSKCTDCKAVLNQRVGKLVLKKQYIDEEFVFYIVHNHYFESAMITAGQGAAQKNISNENILEYSFSITSNVMEQKQIGEFFLNLDNLIILHQKKCEKLVAQRNILQKYLLTGIVRV